MDDGVRHRLEITPAAALRRGDPEDREHQPAGCVAHVVTQPNRIVGLTNVHRCIAAADVAVTQEAAPAATQLGGIFLLFAGELADVSQQVALLGNVW